MYHIYAISLCAVGFTLPATKAFSAQDQSAPFDLVELREQIHGILLSPQPPAAMPLIDHLWKSNGGALILRSARNVDARVLAEQLVGLMDYDLQTETLYWPVYGFADPYSARFTPTNLWDTLLRPYFADPQFDANLAGALGANFVEVLTQRPVTFDPLVPPVGLTMSPEELLCTTGYFGTNLFVYSTSNCVDVAVKCYALGYFKDARVLLSHAIAQQQDARFYYFRGTIEMLTGYPEDAKMSAIGFIVTTPQPPNFGAPYVYERINGPAAIQFRDLIAEFSRPLAPPPVPARQSGI